MRMIASNWAHRVFVVAACLVHNMVVCGMCARNVCLYAINCGDNVGCRIFPGKSRGSGFSLSGETFRSPYQGLVRRGSVDCFTHKS